MLVDGDAHIAIHTVHGDVSGAVHHDPAVQRQNDAVLVDGLLRLLRSDPVTSSRMRGRS